MTAIKSNQVTISVSPAPSCAPCQIYDSILQECTFLTPSAVGTQQPTIPKYLMGVEFNNFYGTGYAGWLNPSSYTGSPCNNPLLTLNVITGTQLLMITGTVTDADGNPVADAGPVCAGLYKVYFSLSTGSVKQSLNTGAGMAYWDFTYSIMDSSGNEISYVEPDTSGNFTVYLGISVSNYSFIANPLSGGACMNPTPIGPFTESIYFGFSKNPSAALNNGIQVVSWDTDIIAKIVA
jgi:hypothetical protein